MQRNQNIIEILKDLQERVRDLEQSTSIKNLTFPVDGVLIIPRAAADPASATNGQIYYNSTTNLFRKYVNGAWANL